MDEHTLADLMKSLPDAVVVIDQMGGVLWINDAAERLFERPAAELVGTNAVDVVHSDDKELAGVALTSIQGKAPRHFAIDPSGKVSHHLLMFDYVKSLPRTIQISAIHYGQWMAVLLGRNKFEEA